MKGSCLASLAGLASLALVSPAFAGGPSVDPMTASAMPTKIDPIRIRGVRIVDGKIVGTTAWRAYTGGQKDAAPSAYAYDAFENGLGVPTDGAGPDGNRYLFLWPKTPPPPTPLFNFTSPVRVGDMTMASGFNGAKSQWADISFKIGDDDNPGVNPAFFLTLTTSEDKLTNTRQWDKTTYDGIQGEFTPTDGFFFSNIDTSTDPTLFWQLPNDGVGSVVMIMTQDDAGTIPAFGQPGMWCTGEDSIPPETRPGTNEPQEGRDTSTAPQCGANNKTNNIPNLVLELPCECQNLPAVANVATALTMCMGFGAEPDTSCYADCDASGVLDIDDFICFQTFYALSDPYADCDGSTILDIDDFICFQTFYAIGCG